MAKTCPSCGYRPIGPFIDNCPICAEPVRNVRGDADGGSAPSWSRRVLTILGIAALCVASCCGLGMWRLGTALQDAQSAIEKARLDAEADRKARTIAVAAADILQEFQNDAATADRKYKGKVLELTGVVERAGAGAGGRSFVILNAGEDRDQLKVECFFDYVNVEGELDGKLKKGQAITVRGEYGGQVSHVQVRGCVLVK